MMARGHTWSGYLVGTGMAAALSSPVAAAPPTVCILVVAVMGGAAILPDWDTESSTASHSLGGLTLWISRGISWVSVAVYHATRLPRDPPNREGGHRLITHTPVGALTFGVLAAITCLLTPIAGGVLCGLLVALGVRAVPTLRLTSRRWLPGGGLALLVIFGAGGWWVLSHESAWWWTVPVAVAVGAHVHREGDWCTKGGVPRRAWPLPEGDKRWARHSSPLHWTTGDLTETQFVTPALAVLTLLSIGWVSGAVPLLLAALTHGAPVLPGAPPGG